LSGLGLLAPSAWLERLKQAQALADQVFTIADDVVAHHPDIYD
jgi:hypothetical protein